MILKELLYMKNYSHLMYSVGSDHVLEVLTNSMWSTMIITGLFFMSFLFLFLSVKVGNSIGTESIENGPVELSFLFSFPGIRYINNHVRHHLFETPLLPRRRFSSLSVSWFSELIKRASFSSRNRDIFSDDDITAAVPEKTRRNSTSVDSHGSRRPSVASKSKRLSVPHINSNRNNVPSVTHSTPQIFSEKNSTAPKVISRRNTLPNIPLISDSSKVYTGTEPEIHEVMKIQHAKVDLMESPTISNSLNTILEEESTEDYESHTVISCDAPTDSLLISKADRENDAIAIISDLEDCESIFGDIITDESDICSISDVQKDTAEKELQSLNSPSEVISVVRKSSSSSQVQTDQCVEQLPSKSTSFRSSYFNYLPESIFGYPTGLNKNYSPISSTNDSSSAPPGFTKRASSHDFTNSNSSNYSSQSNENFNNHQPLYARRRTESSHIPSDATKTFFPFDLTSKFQAIASRIGEVSTGSPNRTNTSSPCLSDLQNTEDLFAPINWNFSNSDQTDSLRKSWNSIENDDNDSVKSFPGSYERDVKESESKHRQSTTFSSLFDGY